jgi:hypothetical protein
MSKVDDIKPGLADLTWSYKKMFVNIRSDLMVSTDHPPYLKMFDNMSNKYQHHSTEILRHHTVVLL